MNEINQRSETYLYKKVQDNQEIGDILMNWHNQYCDMIILVKMTIESNLSPNLQLYSSHP